MGILFLIKNLAPPGSSIYFIYFFSIHFLGILYFWKIHRKIFITKPSGGKAVFFGLIGFGFGQLYNLQPKKGLVFFILFAAFLMNASFWVIEFKETAYLLTGFGLIVLPLIDAGLNAENAFQRLKASNRKNHLRKKIKAVLEYRQENYEFCIDTNILLHEPDLLVYILENEPVPLHVSMTVFKELDGLKKNKEPLTRKRAQFAFDIIEEYQRKGLIKLIETPSYNELRRKGLSDTPDDKIIGTYLNESHKGKQKLIFLSNDKGARIIARNSGLPVAEI